MKNKKIATIEDKRILLYSMGLVVAFSITLMSLEIQQTAAPRSQVTVEDVVFDVVSPPITMREAKPAPPPPPPKLILSDILVVSKDNLDDFDPFDDNQLTVTDIKNHVSQSLYTEGNEHPTEDGDGDIVYDQAFVEKMPVFPGGMTALRKYLASHVIYPEMALQIGISGMVIVQFIVDKDGSVADVTISRGVDPLLDKEALRVVKGMPKWTPGEQAGRPVRVRYSVPVVFRLR